MTKWQRFKNKYYLLKSKVFRKLAVKCQAISKNAYIKAYHIRANKHVK